MKDKTISNYLLNLEKHLEDENPILLEAAKTFHELDRIAYDSGLIEMNESTACRISWWPLISILGTFSAGKSTFINQFLGVTVQRTGSQAVDEKFTVLHYSQDTEIATLPGIALDADPRFPFYQISKEIEQVATGEGQRINAYLQLRTCPSERLKGNILIDSPGFDADSQRTATLRITKHIIDLSDLVLIFFDARRPEVGAMRDTLRHLVAETINRHDSNKFMFILNQMDATAREDNPEDVVSAWQRALAEHGLTAGRFYTIYSKDAAVPIDNEKLRAHFEQKRDRDLKEIDERMESVGVERAYRILGSLENTAREIDKVAMPEVWTAIKQWKTRAYIADFVIFLIIAAVSVFLALETGIHVVLMHPVAAAFSLAGLLVFMGGVHVFFSRLLAKRFIKKLKTRTEELNLVVNLALAFEKNTSLLRILLPVTRPIAWTPRTRNNLLVILEKAKELVQALNNTLSNPSGQVLHATTSQPQKDPDKNVSGDRQSA